MYNKRNTIVLSAMLLLFFTQACQTQQLMCYVCENCERIAADTPLRACNGDFFMHDGSTTMPTTTTTTTTTTMMPTTESRAPTSNTGMGTSSTTEGTTSTTEPTPPTVGPPMTTTPMPTPPNLNTIIYETHTNTTPESVIVELETTMPSTTQRQTTSTTSENETIHVLNSTSFVPLTHLNVSTLPNFPEFNVRHTREVRDGVYTYHCYKLQKNANGTMKIERGCSRVTSNMGVCQQLKMMNNATKTNKCTACDNNRCNGSSMLSISLLTLLLGVIAFVLNRK